MNDFYSPRRTIIADVAGLVGMAIAGTASSALVWETLATGFRTGKLERAFLVFLLVVLGAAAIGGLLGLAAGRAIGRSWEERHRRHRPPSSPDDGPSPVELRARAAPDESAVATAPGVTLRPFGAEVAEFMALLERSGVDGDVRTADVLRRSTNIGAWDGPRLVGAVRVVSDGRVGLVADLVVEPAYRRRGIGRGLGEAARARSGGELLFPMTSPDASPFLSALGARRVENAWRLGGRVDQRTP